MLDGGVTFLRRTGFGIGVGADADADGGAVGTAFTALTGGTTGADDTDAVDVGRAVTRCK